MNPGVRTLHWRSLPGADDITRAMLPNGIVVLTRSNFASQSISLGGYLCCGSLFDPDGQLGLAHYTASMLMRGTVNRTFQQVYDILETAGASLGFGVGVHNTGFAGRALAEDLPLLLEMLADCACNPVFPVEHVERLRSIMLTGLAIRAQDTAEVASLEFDRALFNHHPYGRPDDGEVETIQRIRRDDLAEFHRLHYGPAGMVVVIVGAVHPRQAVEAVERALGGWQNLQQPNQPKLPPTRLPRKTIRKHFPLPGKIQTDLVMGTLGPPRLSPDYLPASLGNNILGQFGLMGRIGDVVRERAGLAYHASASLNSGIASGSWEISAGVNPANLSRAIDLILQELIRFASEPVRRRELADSKANFIGRLPLSMESNAGVANALLNLERYQLGLDYYRQYPGLVRGVTELQILETARKYINPERLVIISSGTEI